MSNEIKFKKSLSRRNKLFLYYKRNLCETGIFGTVFMQISKYSKRYLFKMVKFKSGMFEMKQYETVLVDLGFSQLKIVIFIRIIIRIIIL